MKTPFLVATALFLGIVLGIAMAWVRLARCPWEGPPLVAHGSGAFVSPHLPVAPAPKLVVEQSVFKFGSMDIDEKGSHDFVIANQGAALLTLTKGDTSCRCALSKLERPSIPPGQSGKVTLEYKSTAALGPYYQTATLFTNDPANPRFLLAVSGKITAALRAVPAELIFPQVSAEEPASGQVQVYCYRPEPLEIRRHRWSDPKIADLFEAQLTPLSQELLLEEKDARSGVQLDITIKPGLPQGPFKQKILLTTNLPSKPELTIPVEGKIGGAISIVGPDWNNTKGVLRIGTVKSQENLYRQLLLIVRGPQRREIRFHVVEPIPKPLKVTLGKTREMKNGQVTQTPLTIEISRGSRPVNHLGGDRNNWAKITLETTHSKTPKIFVFVQFAVEG